MCMEIDEMCRANNCPHVKQIHFQQHNTIIWLVKSFFWHGFMMSRRSVTRTVVTVTQRQSWRPFCFYTSSRPTPCLAPVSHPHQLNLPADSCGNHSMCHTMAFPLLMQVIWPFLLVMTLLDTSPLCLKGV